MSPTSTQTLSDYLKTQEEDKMCTSVSIYCQKGWPERKNKIATEISPYWNARSELTVDKNSLLLYQKRIVVPKTPEEHLRRSTQGTREYKGADYEQTQQFGGLDFHIKWKTWFNSATLVHRMLPLGNST